MWEQRATDFLRGLALALLQRGILERTNLKGALYGAPAALGRAGGGFDALFDGLRQGGGGEEEWSEKA